MEVLLLDKIFDSYPDVLEVEDLMKALSISKTSAYQLLREKKINSVKIGRVYKIPKVYLLNFIEQLASE